MQALKALVVVMGVLLVGGTLALALVIVSRVSNRNHMAADGPAVHASLTLPQDAKIADIAGLGDRLALHLVSPDGDSILVVNPSSGATISTLEIKR